MRLRQRMTAAIGLAALACAACVGPEDVPSNVFDLRVLGVRIEPPELMAPFCVFDPEDPRAAQVFAAFARELQYRALIADPAGGGRDIRFELWACAAESDRTCEGERLPLADGVTREGELDITIAPTLAAAEFLPKVIEADVYKGFGGIRVPLMLHLRAGDEEIFAQKLMVYNCNYFPRPDPASDAPTMVANVNPELPGVTVNGEPWGPDDVPELRGPGPFTVQSLDFRDREETYVTPTFELKPLQLRESWEVAWHATVGRFSPNASGGSTIGLGEEKRIEADWTPGRAATTAQDVTFWFVVRDGRGGTSWLIRRAHHVP